MSAANRRRGADAERAVCAYLRQWWPDARRYLAGDGKQPGDIDAIPGVCIEVKDRAASSWPSWREQAAAEAGHRIPVVVRRTRGVTDVGMWHAQIPLEDWLWLEGDPLIGVVECRRTDMAWAVCAFHQIIHLLKDGTP